MSLFQIENGQLKKLRVRNNILTFLNDGILKHVNISRGIWVINSDDQSHIEETNEFELIDSLVSSKHEGRILFQSKGFSITPKEISDYINEKHSCGGTLALSSFQKIISSKVLGDFIQIDIDRAPDPQKWGGTKAFVQWIVDHMEMGESMTINSIYNIPSFRGTVSSIYGSPEKRIQNGFHISTSCMRGSGMWTVKLTKQDRCQSCGRHF